jgi:cytochrome c556
MPAMFPSGTGIGETSVKTQAKPEIWKDRATFEQRAADYAAAADKLADLAKANDAEDFKAQLAEVSLKCDACHATFKAGDQKPPSK